MESLQPLLFMAISKTDNNHYSVIFTFLIVLLPYICRVIPLNIIYDKINNYFTRNPDYEYVNIPSHDVPVLRGFSTTPVTKVVYSKTFLSIIHYIVNNQKIRFNSLTEIMTNNTELNRWYNEEHDLEKQKETYLMMPIDNGTILISEKYGIYFELKNNSDEKKEEDSQKTNSVSSKQKNNFTIVLSKKKNLGSESHNIHDFIEECISEYDSMMNKKINDNRQYIFDYKGFEKEETVLTLKFNEHLMEHNKDLNTNIFFEGKDKLIRYIHPFVYDKCAKMNEGEEKYKRSGFTFKAGLLFYGQPGCGKTSTIKAILKYTNRHGIILNLSRVKTCEELEMIFRNRVINKRELTGKQICFILEDCDAFENNICMAREYNEQKPITQTPSANEFLKVVPESEQSSSDLFLQMMCKKNFYKDDDAVNLSCFLNILDGIVELHGVMIIMTTNHPEKIDPALIRPGRFDFKYEFKKATKQILLEMLQFKYQISSPIEIEYKDGSLSPAEIQPICFKHDNIYDAIKEIQLTTV
jgi:hypothetical protein